MSSFNLSATFNVFRLIFNPSLCLPHATVATFNQIPIPISKAFSPDQKGTQPDIRAVVLDKDNCFAIPHESVVYDGYKVRRHGLQHKRLTHLIASIFPTHESL